MQHTCPGRHTVPVFFRDIIPVLSGHLPRTQVPGSAGEGRGDAPMTGGLNAIRVNDLAGQPCDVQAAVLLQVSEGQILQEELFYESQSLVKCSWAR